MPTLTARLSHRAWLVPVALLLTAALPIARQERVDEEFFVERAESLLRRALAQGEFEGAAVAMALGDTVLWQGGWGEIDGRPADPESAFPASALTEIFTVAVALHLVEEGHLDLDAEVQSYLPGMAWEGEKVLVRHLLGQSSGLSTYSGPMPSHRGEPQEREEAIAQLTARMKHLARYGPMLESLKASSLEHEPGTCLTWSNANVLLLGVVVEAVSGRELHDLLPTLFFEPLELESTSFLRTPREPSPRSGELEVGSEVQPLEASFAPLAGLELRTSALDLVRWQRSLLERTILEEASVELMLGEHRLNDGSVVPYGCGTGRTLLGEHAGLTYGGRSGSGLVHVAHYPAFDLTVALLAEGNLEKAGSLERQLVRLLFDLPGDSVEDRQLAQAELARYAGTYQLGCNRLALVIEDDALVFDSVLHGRQVLLYQGAHVFVAQADHELRLLFQLRVGEPAHAVVVDDAGVQGMAVRIPE